MRLSKILKLSFNMLIHSRLRSWLTIIGIFIGVAAVVAIITLGDSMQESVKSQISGLGQDIITISSGSSRAQGGGGFGGESSTAINVNPLSDKDVLTLKLVPGVKYINGIVSGRAKVRYQTQNTSLSVQGQDLSLFKEFVATPLSSGRYLSPGESRAIVIGNDVANRIFSKQLGVGYILTISEKPFRIVGILSRGTEGGSDSGIYMSTKDAREVLNSTLDLKQTEFSSITVKVADADYVNETSNAISDALRNAHHTAVGKEDFSVTSALALQERFSSMMSSITLFLGLLAAVSLLVGSVGVANTMFTAVLERTKDIGVMKAIGSRNKDILLIFLLNSGMLGLVGGILGIAGGVAISYALPLFVNLGFGPGGGGSITTAISPSLLIFTMIFSLAIGTLSGAIPAYKASKMKPVDALRYE
jgi:putative ABC transport system permease protein